MRRGTGLRLFRPAIEPLEDRCVPAVQIHVQSGSLIIDGDNNGDVVYVDGPTKTNQIHVGFRSGLNSPPNNFYCPLSKVERITFIGGVKSDSFTNRTNLPSFATGGGGDDSLISNGHGIADGGEGNDQIIGFDVAFGGVQSPGHKDLDDLVGNHVDLLMANQSYLRYSKDVINSYLAGGKFASEFGVPYSVMILQNADATWTDSEVNGLAHGLRVLLEEVPNGTLLYGPPVTGYRPVITRVHHLDSTDVDSHKVTVGKFSPDGSIAMSDSAFADPGVAAMTLIHELGHAWYGNPQFQRTTFEFQDASFKAMLQNLHIQWNQLSDWRSTVPSSAAKYTHDLSSPWWHLKSAGFGRGDYGTANPWEDWSTAWESYFYFKYADQIGTVEGKLRLQRLPATKQQYLTAFFSYLSHH
jgi:hypothetical protein